MTRVHQFSAKENQSVEDYIEQVLKTGAFNAGRLGNAAQVLREMVFDKDTKVYLGLSGALVPAGMRKLINTCMKEEFIDVLVTTGANLTHDLLESFNLHHELLTTDKTDKELGKEGINRIYDVYITNDKFVTLEEKLLILFEEIYNEEPFDKISTNEIVKKIGLKLNNDESIITMAAKKNIPIFCPAITDSILGLHLMTFFKEKKILLDPLDELYEIIDLSFTAKKTGAIILGGGVPKNYIFQSMLFSGRELEYVIQITMDRPEHGGLSGATLEEAVSWGKVSEKGKSVVVIADVTIVFPLLVSYLLTKKND